MRGGHGRARPTCRVGDPCGTRNGGPPGVHPGGTSSSWQMGSRGQGRPGPGGLVAHSCGILATVHSGVSTVSFSPWTVEWASELDAWDLVASQRVLPCEFGMPLATTSWLSWALTGARRWTAPRLTTSG